MSLIAISLPTTFIYFAVKNNASVKTVLFMNVWASFSFILFLSVTGITFLASVIFEHYYNLLQPVIYLTGK